MISEPGIRCEVVLLDTPAMTVLVNMPPFASRRECLLSTEYNPEQRNSIHSMSVGAGPLAQSNAPWLYSLATSSLTVMAVVAASGGVVHYACKSWSGMLPTVCMVPMEVCRLMGVDWRSCCYAQISSGSS